MGLPYLFVHYHIPKQVQNDNCSIINNKNDKVVKKPLFLI